MPDESRILQLLEEVLDSRRTPEDVCVDSPELLWEVRERWERCQNVEAQIEAMFPPTGSEKKLKRCLRRPATQWSQRGAAIRERGTRREI